MKSHALAAFCAAFLIYTAAAAQNVGIGLTNPQDRLHVLSPLSSVGGLRVDVSTGTALRVHPNGGTSIGTTQTPPPGGLIVDGVIRPLDSIKATQNAIHIVSTADSIVLFAGGSRIILASNGAVRILAGGTSGITIDGGAGPVAISGSTVNVTANGTFGVQAGSSIALSSSAGFTATAGATATISGNQTLITASGIAKMNGSQILVGNTGLAPAARSGSPVQVNTASGSGSVTSGSVKVFIE